MVLSMYKLIEMRMKKYIMKDFFLFLKQSLTFSKIKTKMPFVPSIPSSPFFS